MKQCLLGKIKLWLLLFMLQAAIPAAWAQGVTVNGRVTSENGEGLPGVMVLEKGTTNGAATDVSGNYSLQVKGSSSVLVVSFLGYTSKEVAVNNQTTININRSPDAKTLEEVVVVGYGTQKKATITGAVTSVKGDEVTKSPTINVSNSLAGRLPGLTAVASSGEPGADGAKLRIRGVNSFGSSEPGPGRHAAGDRERHGPAAPLPERAQRGAGL